MNRWNVPCAVRLRWGIKIPDTPSDFFNRELELTPESVGRVSVYFLVNGVHAVNACVSAAMGDRSSLATHLSNFVRASGGRSKNMDLFLGSSGVLLAGSMLLELLPANRALSASNS